MNTKHNPQALDMVGGEPTVQKLAQNTVTTVYCIGREGDVGGVDWFVSANARAGTERFDGDVLFDLDVPVDSSPEEVTHLADYAGWNKLYEQGGSCRKVHNLRVNVRQLVNKLDSVEDVGVEGV